MPLVPPRLLDRNASTTPTSWERASLLVGAAMATAAGAWMAASDWRERKRIRAARMASSGPHLCELRLTRSGLLLNGAPITAADALARCPVGVEIVADAGTTETQRADAVRIFERAGRPWLLRW
jgi:hypothetical protein